MWVYIDIRIIVLIGKIKEGMTYTQPTGCHYQNHRKINTIFLPSAKWLSNFKLLIHGLFMSYDICLIDEHSGETLKLDEKLDLKGGTYAVDGTKEAWLNITWNYSPFFQELFGEEGIRTIYGMKADESIPILEAAISKLDDDVDENNYWKATSGNAKKALQGLLKLAILRPDGVWDGD
jgi:hypothetical protein